MGRVTLTADICRVSLVVLYFRSIKSFSNILLMLLAINMLYDPGKYNQWGMPWYLSNLLYNLIFWLGRAQNVVTAVQFVVWALQWKVSSLVSIKSLLKCFPKKQGLYYQEASYIYAKSSTLTYLRDTKWAIETMSSNCFRLASISCSSTW